jgi:hypothetical protein
MEGFQWPLALTSDGQDYVESLMKSYFKPGRYAP